MNKYPFISGTLMGLAYVAALFLIMPWGFKFFEWYFPWVKSFGT